MDRLQQLQIFAAVVDAGSFAGAALRLHISPPAVTRAIAALEDRLGARVLSRTTRSVTLTDTGRRFLEKTRRILADLDAAEKEAIGEAAAPQGHLAVTASASFGRSALMPVVRDFLSRYPRVSVTTLLLDRVVNLVDEGVDVAVRIGHLADSSMIATRVGAVRRVLVASPAYLARRGTPRAPADLRGHAVIAFTGLMPNREWRFQTGRRSKAMVFTPRLETNDAASAIAAAEMGEGITIALSYMVAGKVREGSLACVLDRFALPPLPVNLIHPDSRLISPKVRSFIDFAAPRLRTTLADLSIPIASEVDVSGGAPVTFRT